MPKGIAEIPVLAMTREDLLIEVDHGELSGLFNASHHTLA